MYVMYTGFQLATGQGQGLALGALKLQHDPQAQLQTRECYPPFHLLVLHCKPPSIRFHIVQSGMHSYSKYEECLYECLECLGTVNQLRTAIQFHCSTPYFFRATSWLSWPENGPPTLDHMQESEIAEVFPTLT